MVMLGHAQLRADCAQGSGHGQPDLGSPTDRLLDRYRDQRRTRNGNGGYVMAVATNDQQVIEWIPTQLYIGGEWRDGSDGETIAVEDPATQETLVEVASG